MVYFDPMGHMVADSVEELHKFAALIGLKRGWYQNKGRYSHYDLCRKNPKTGKFQPSEFMKKRAQDNGAHKVSPRKILEVLGTLKTDTEKEEEG